MEAGEEVVQETLHFHPEDGSLTPLRSKEYAHDYRYFPSPTWSRSPRPRRCSRRRASPPRAARGAARALRLGGRALEEAATTLAFQAEYGEYFERAMAAADGASAKAIANWVTGELVAALREAGARRIRSGRRRPPRRSPRSPAWSSRSDLARVRQAGAGQAGRGGGDPAAIVESEGLGRSPDSSELEAIVDGAIEAEPEAAEQVRDGNEKAIGRIMGAVMKETQGRADGGAGSEADQGLGAN